VKYDVQRIPVQIIQESGFNPLFILLLHKINKQKSNWTKLASRKKVWRLWPVKPGKVLLRHDTIRTDEIPTLKSNNQGHQEFTFWNSKIPTPLSAKIPENSRYTHVYSPLW